MQTHSKKNSSKRAIKPLNTIIFLLIAICITAISIASIYSWNYIKAHRINKQIKDLVSIDTTPSAPSGSETHESNISLAKPLPDFSKLVAANENFVGWVKIADTSVDNVVVQGADNERYLSTDFYGKHSALGTIFADYRANISAASTSDNIILFGHSGKDNSFFADVRRYREQSFLDSHPTISFDTRYEAANWEVIAGFSYDANDLSDDNFHYINYIDLSSKTVYDAFLKEINTRALAKSDAECQFGDKFITLSTCDYTFKNERFVVVARKIK